MRTLPLHRRKLGRDRLENIDLDGTDSVVAPKA
jgi:hypothetical protein